MDSIAIGDVCTWTTYTQYGWRERKGRVTRKLTACTWEVVGDFGVHFIDPKACQIKKVSA